MSTDSFIAVQEGIKQLKGDTKALLYGIQTNGERVKAVLAEYTPIVQELALVKINDLNVEEKLAKINTAKEQVKRFTKEILALSNDDVFAAIVDVIRHKGAINENFEKLSAEDQAKLAPEIDAAKAEANDVLDRINKGEMKEQKKPMYDLFDLLKATGDGFTRELKA